MSTRTTIEFDHDHIDKLAEYVHGRDRRQVLAGLLFGAISGDPEQAEILERRFGFRIVAQKRVEAPSIAASAES